MRGKTVAILETRAGEHLGELIARRGAVPLLAPALDEVPDFDPQALTALLREWRVEPFRVVIFQTGVGTRALFRAADELGVVEEILRLLTETVVVVRGPKPSGELNARQVRIDLRAAVPFTTEKVLEALSDVALERAPVLVQRYGAANQPLRQSLEARGAQVREIATYRWALPQDTTPLVNLLDALAGARVSAVLFTSAVQVQHLFAVAESHRRAHSLAALFDGLVVGSIGPVCTRALLDRGIKPSFEASPPKLGPLVAGLEAALGPGG